MEFDIKMKHLIPREHGAWAMLFVPMIMGLSVAKWSFDIGLICVLMVLFFIAHHPINTYLKQSNNRKNQSLLHVGCLLYVTITLGGFYLLIQYFSKPFFLMGSIAMSTFLLHLYFSYKKQELSTLNELIGIIGLTVSAPLLYLMSEQKLDFTTYYLWCINFVYFASTVFYIKLRVRTLPKIKISLPFIEKVSIGKWTLLSLILPMIYMGLYFNILTILPLIPSLIKVGWILTTWSPSQKINIKHIGYLEAVMSILFLVITPIIINNLGL